VQSAALQFLHLLSGVGVSADREGALGSLYPFLCGARKDEAGQAGATAPRRSLPRFH